MNLKHFWGVLPSVFTKDFWIVNKKLRKDSLGWYIGDTYEIKKWAKSKGYEWDNTWYLDGEKYLYKNGIPVCMVQPLYHKQLTRYTAWQPDYEEYVNKNKTFLLNHNKTANAIFEHICEEKHILFKRSRLYDKISSKLKDKAYIKSDEFLDDLSSLSFGNYYDILALKENKNLTTKEKKEYIGDYCDYDSITLKHYISFEEAEELDKQGEKDYPWNWTADFIPTALTDGSIDSVLCIDPNRLPQLKVTPELLKRMHKRFFNGL